jgi:hypothetical protein
VLPDRALPQIRPPTFLAFYSVPEVEKTKPEALRAVSLTNSSDHPLVAERSSRKRFAAASNDLLTRDKIFLRDFYANARDI